MQSHRYYRYADDMKFMKKVDLVVVIAGVTFDANTVRLKAIKGRDIIKDN